MSSEKPSIILDVKGLENIELQSVVSISNQNPEVLDRLKTDPTLVKKDSVFGYLGSKIRSLFAKIPPLTAEAVLFLYMFSYLMRNISSTSMIIDKVCLVHLGYSEDICSKLKDYPTIKSDVTKMANNYSLGYSLIQVLPSSMMALFIGSWSDKYGRKVPMILASLGIIVDGLGATLCAYFLLSRVEFYFISTIFNGCSGGFIGVLAVLYSYASDISSTSNRIIKYATMQLAFGISMPLGSLVGGWVFKFYGYVPVFAASTCGHVVGLCCIIIFMKETRGLEVKDGWITKFRSFWSLEEVKSSIKETAKKRPNKGRAQIWLLILAMSIFVFSYTSRFGVLFLFVRYQFDWDNTWFSTVSSIYMGIGFAMMMIIVPLSKKLKVSDASLGILGTMSLLLKNVGTGVASEPWIYHVAMVLGLCNNLSALSCKSRISKVIPKDDLGKVFGFVSTAESLIPIAATTIVSQTFNATLDFFPGLVFIAMGLMMLVPLGIFIWISHLPVLKNEEMNKENKHEDMNKENKHEERNKENKHEEINKENKHVQEANGQATDEPCVTKF